MKASKLLIQEKVRLPAVGVVLLSLFSFALTSGVYANPSQDNPLAKQSKVNYPTVKLDPKIRVDGSSDPQLGIPVFDIRRFFRFAYVSPKEDIKKWPKVGYLPDDNMIIANRDIFYSTCVEGVVGDKLSIYRKPKKYQDPKTKETLGYLSFKVADADILEIQAQKKNNMVMQVNNAVEAVDKSMFVGKPLNPAVLDLNYLKLKPVQSPVEGYIIDAWDTHLSNLGTNMVVVLSLGNRDGLKIGDVLDIYRNKEGRNIGAKAAQEKAKNLPDIRVGKLMVYQVDEKMSIGMITAIYEKVFVLDKVKGQGDNGSVDPCEDQTLGVHFFDGTCCDTSTACDAQPKKE